MKRKNLNLRRIDPGLLLKWGCPVHLYVKTRWHELIPEPVCEWGIPVGMEGDALLVEVRDRTCLAAFRSQEEQIMERLSGIGVRVNGLVWRVRKQG